LIAEQYDLDVQIETGFLEVTETLVVTNPATAAYVGEAVGEMPPVTLKLAIPSAFERVTFYDEFHGRRFQVVAGHVATDIPWPPGERTLKFTYRLPAAELKNVFERTLDLPCRRLRVTVSGKDAGEVGCNLDRIQNADSNAAVFESAQASLPAGHRVQLQFGRLPIPWVSYARWASFAVLAVLIGATVWKTDLNGRRGRWLRSKSCRSAK
jgi:hypothetical protein